MYFHDIINLLLDIIHKNLLQKVAIMPILDPTYITKIEDGRMIYDHKITKNPMNEIFEAHTHDVCEILLLIKGNVSYIVEGKTYKLKKGDVVLSRPSVIHRIRPDGNDDYERYNVIYNEKNLPRSLIEKIPQGVDVFRFEDDRAIEEVFERLEAYALRFCGEELYHLARNLIEEVFFLLAGSEAKDRDSSINPLVGNALNYISEHLTEIKNISEICDALYITKSHLHHLFIKNIQMSPKQYINSKRLIKARKLIRKGGKPTEIYTDCGFDDYATFFRNYKKYFGYKPSEEDISVIKKERTS